MTVETNSWRESASFSKNARARAFAGSGSLNESEPGRTMTDPALDAVATLKVEDLIDEL